MTTLLTYADVAAHNAKKDLYVVIHDSIYNASSFVDEHPCAPSPFLHVQRTGWKS
jgi:cytochrome b involved in lipid metabolism